MGDLKFQDMPTQSRGHGTRQIARGGPRHALGRLAQLSLHDHQRDVIQRLAVAEEFGDRVLNGHHEVWGGQRAILPD
jgi:hypothetical protein